MSIADILRLVKYIIVLVILIPAAISDWKTHRVKKYYSFAICGISILFNIIIYILDKDMHEFLFTFIGGVSAGFVFLLLAVLNVVGGADVLIASALGFAMGFKHVFEVCIIAELLSITYAIISYVMTKKDTDNTKAKIQAPLVPFILISYVIDILLNIFVL